MTDSGCVKAWSFSAYDLWATCPLKYKLEKIDKLDTVTSDAMLRGREIHNSLAGYLKGESPAPEIRSATARQLHDEIRQFDNVVIEQQWGFDRQWRPTGWFTKQPPAKATWLRTVVDAAVLYEDMSAEIIDHKTGKNRGGYDDQLELFAVAAMQHMPSIEHVTTRLSFVDHEETVMGEYPRAEREKLIAKWEDKVAPMFADTEFLPRPNAMCRFCDFRRSNGGVCKYG